MANPRENQGKIRQSPICRIPATQLLVHAARTFDISALSATMSAMASKPSALTDTELTIMSPESHR
jgi:hypothetical protein